MFFASSPLILVLYASPSPSYCCSQGSRLGAESVIALMGTDTETPARIMGIRWNQVVCVNLDYAVTKVMNGVFSWTARSVSSYLSFAC